MLRVMIIGCGAIAPAHVEGYLKFPGMCRITALANRSISRADELNSRYGLGAKTVSDYRDALGNVDIVSICTPPREHASIALDAIDAGCHALIEKPMATSLDECDAIIASSKKENRVVSVVAQSRFISGIRNAISVARSGRFGRVLYARANSVWYRGGSYYDLSWRGRWEVEGGGCTLNHSIHHIDLLLWLKGLPKSVISVLANLSHDNSEEEDFSSSILTYCDGSVAEITSSLVSHGEPQCLSFQMERGGIAIPFAAHASATRDNGFPYPDETRRREIEAAFAELPTLTHENHDGQIANFLAAINGDEGLIADASDGRNCIELITGIYKSGVGHSSVTLPIDCGDEFYGNRWRASAPHFNEKKNDVAHFDDMTITDFKGKF
ncbi:MAG: Gfo/Idh/MocA family oxidoreductase [Synergistaceae bacterium]|jgi:predicted dehydrogenase|nr:Gfo/Idh/MocA family oxidoreductase [Synergistaceae bacterium]